MTVSELKNLDKPKSLILISVSFASRDLSNMFSGLRSRWLMPMSCKYWPCFIFPRKKETNKCIKQQDCTKTMYTQIVSPLPWLPPASDRTKVLQSIISLSTRKGLKKSNVATSEFCSCFCCCCLLVLLARRICQCSQVCHIVRRLRL